MAPLAVQWDEVVASHILDTHHRRGGSSSGAGGCGQRQQQQAADGAEVRQRRASTRKRCPAKHEPPACACVMFDTVALAQRTCTHLAHGGSPLARAAAGVAAGLLAAVH